VTCGALLEEKRPMDDGAGGINAVEVRKLFPATEQLTYMNVAVRGLLSTRVRQAVDSYIDSHQHGTWEKEAELAMIERTRDSFARLINAQPDEIGFTKNASEGLNAIAASLPWKAGDNVVFCPELEHPNNVYPWLNLERRLGVEVRSVEPDDGKIPTERILKIMDEKTRLVTVPTVSFAPGFVTDIGPIAKRCREMDAFLLVDAAQSVGVEHTDVEAMGVDALAVATQKGMMAFYGTGFLYCRRERAEEIEPAYLARYGVDLDANAHETAMDVERMEYAPGARRFDLGNYNYLGAAAVEASMKFIHEIGTAAIEKYVRGLAFRFIEGMLELGLPVEGGARRAITSGTSSRWGSAGWGGTIRRTIRGSTRCTVTWSRTSSWLSGGACYGSPSTSTTTPTMSTECWI
jgi:cysteine desulfurase/selenocysteine lyase